MPLNIAATKSAHLLLDTGSDITILKLQCADLDAYVNIDNILKLKGITSEITTSLGVCQGKFILGDNVSISHPIHLVPNDFPISCDGILGKDFLSQNKAIINYKIPMLILKVHEQQYFFKMQNPEVIVVPARTEYLAKIPISITEPKVCLQKEICEGVIVGNSIVNPLDGTCKISVINSNENPVTFSLNHLEFDDLNNYDILSISSSTEPIPSRNH